MSKWCIDPNAEVVPDQTYDETDAAAPPEGPEEIPETTEASQPDSQEAPEQLYGAPGLGGGNDYDYEGDNFDLAPPPLPRDNEEAFEQAESSFEEPVFEIDDSVRDQNFGGPRQGGAGVNTLYDAPAPSVPRGNNRGGPRRGNGGPRRKQNGGRRRGKQITQPFFLGTNITKEVLWIDVCGCNCISKPFRALGVCFKIYTVFICYYQVYI